MKNNTTKNNTTENDFNKSILKKSSEELQEFFHFRKRGFITKSKKGKGSYSRKQKHKDNFKEDS